MSDEKIEIPLHENLEGVAPKIPNEKYKKNMVDPTDALTEDEDRECSIRAIEKVKREHDKDLALMKSSIQIPKQNYALVTFVGPTMNQKTPDKTNGMKIWGAFNTLEQAQKDGSIVMKDTGDIGKLHIKNAGSVPVYIRMGQIFAGVGTQPRTAIHSIVILPSRSKVIDVRCVSASTPIRRDAGFEVGGVVPSETENVLVESMVSPELSGSLQSNVWRTASSFPRQSVERLASSPMVNEEVLSQVRPRFSDDLSESTKAFKQLISDILNKVPISENQVGMALLDVAGCRGLEVFDVPISWKELRDDIVAKHGEAIEEPGESVFQYIPEKAKALVQDVLRQDYHHRLVWEDGPAKTYAIHNGRMAGEVTELNEKIIHMVINRKTQLDRPPVAGYPMLDLQERVERSQARLERLMVALEEARAGER